LLIQIKQGPLRSGDAVRCNTGQTFMKSDFVAGVRQARTPMLRGWAAYCAAVRILEDSAPKNGVDVHAASEPNAGGRDASDSH
jgi:hypothetical protein